MRRAAIVLASVGAVLFVLSGVFKNGGGWKTVVGGVGWFGFLACLLGLLALAASSSLRARGRRS